MEMCLDLRLKQKNVTITNKDGKEEKFVLYEATGTQRDLQAKFVMSKHNKETGETDLVGTKEHFLGMLLRRKNSNTPVGEKFFIGFPAPARDKIFEAAQKLSGMTTELELYKMLREKSIQRQLDKLEAEAAGEEYIDPDEEEEKRIAEEEAAGKE